MSEFEGVYLRVVTTCSKCEKETSYNLFSTGDREIIKGCGLAYCIGTTKPVHPHPFKEIKP